MLKWLKKLKERIIYLCKTHDWLDETSHVMEE